MTPAAHVRPAALATAPRPTLGVVCGLKREAQALGRWRADPRLALGYSGARAGAARREAERLADLGVDALLSFGLVGGLVEGLTPGELVAPKRLVDADGAASPVNPAAPTGARPINAIVNASQIIATPQDKAGLARNSGGQAVDMESFELAEVAHRRGLSFSVLRAVADPADLALPPAALAATTPEGGTDIWAILRALSRDPAQLPGLLKLGRHAGAGLRSLRRAADAEIPRLLARRASGPQSN